MKKDRRGINTASKPSGSGCVECLASPKGWWLHLRRCAECGHIGCCDSSPSQHASKHAAATGHPIIMSFEPGEDWFFDYEKQRMVNGVELLPPHSHPEDQPAPGPSGRVQIELGYRKLTESSLGKSRFQFQMPTSRCRFHPS
jgi:Zn-finger in ubiquitin-hydrolases and other protein